jgi:BASS family bile acid:Na+ symporter
VAQFVLLPFLTCLLTLLLKPHPSLALGMILVSSCPGGSFSNIITFIARGNLAVSVSMTAVSSLLAVVMTPLNFAFYAWMNPATRDVMTQVKLDPWSMVALVFTVVGLPLLLGMFCGQRFPTLKAKSETAMRTISLVVFFGFVGLAFSQNWALFVTHTGGLALLVVVHNLMALGLGFCLATLFRQPEADRRAITLEIGIQNSGLGLTLLFTFMSGLGGAILITAFWGIWHLVSGLLIAVFWGRRPVIVTEEITDAG